MCAVVWNVCCGISGVMCNLYLNVVMCMTWCEVECGHDVEWCVEIWWGDLVCIIVDVKCGICKVLCDCCVVSDVEKDAICCDVRCGGVM